MTPEGYEKYIGANGGKIEVSTDVACDITLYRRDLTGASEAEVGSGSFVGSDGKFRPLDNITRAETATLVLELLQKTGFVDVRTPLTAQVTKTAAIMAI